MEENGREEKRKRKRRKEDFHFASFEERLPTRLGGGFWGV